MASKRRIEIYTANVDGMIHIRPVFFKPDEPDKSDLLLDIRLIPISQPISYNHPEE